MTESLTRAEILEQLADLLRNGNDTARIRAGEALLRQPEYAFDITAGLDHDDTAPADPFVAVDGDDELDRRRQRAA